MSIAAMKRRANATIGVSAGPEGRFSLQGNHRLPPTFLDRPGIAPWTSPYSTEDATVPKRASMSNAGMLASRFPKSAFTTVKTPLTNFRHQDYLDHLKRQRLATCPDPAVKELAARCSGRDVQTGGTCIARSLERAWSLAASVAPSMPGRTGARDYSEWLAAMVVKSYEYDAYTQADIRTAREIAARARAAADAAEQERILALQRKEAAEADLNTAVEELNALQQAAADATAAAEIAEAAADLAQAFLDGLIGTAPSV